MIDGNYEDVKDRLVKDSRIVKYVSKFPDDDSYRRLVAFCVPEEGSNWFVDAMCIQKNYKQAFVYAHTLKGLAQTLGFTKLALCSGAVTEALRNDQYALAEIKLPDLTRAYNATISAIAFFLKQSSEH